MPPISVEMKIGNKDIKLPDIAAGGSGSFTDRGPGGNTILTVLCNQTDDGAVVYRQPESGTLEIMDKKLRIVQPSTGETEVFISKDEGLSVEIYTKFGRGTLTLRQFNE